MSRKRSWEDDDEVNGTSALSDRQAAALALAKKYCSEQTEAFKLAKQQAAMAPQLQRMIMVQESAQRQRAFQLMCRVYVGSISFEMREDQIRQAFIPFGPIKSIDLAWDNITMKHKGFCFIEYETPEAAQLALDQMNGVMLGGRNIKCGRPSSMPAAAPVIAQLHAEAELYNRIYIGSIHPDLSETDLKCVFEAFGTIKSIQLAPDPVPGRHRGFAFIEYDTKQGTLDAVASMNLFDLGGQYLRVGRALTAPIPIGASPGMPFIPSSANAAVAASQAAASAITAQLNLATNMATALPTAAQPTDLSAAGMAARIQAAQAVAEKAQVQSLHTEESMSISGNSARQMVMQKLQRKIESRVVVLRNMVGVDDLDDELEGEVTEECSRYGNVKRVIIYQERQGEDDSSAVVKIFVAFTEGAEADRAVSALDGRFFGGRTIKAELYDQDRFMGTDYSG